MTTANHTPDKHRDDALSSVPDDEKQALREIWLLTSEAEHTPHITEEQIELTWQTLSTFAQADTSATAEKLSTEKRPVLRLLKFKRTWMAMAATLLLGAIGITWWNQPVQIMAPLGEQLAVTLPDGSSISLNSGSVISYPRRFSNTRTIQLEGEAYLDVTHNEAPFVVETFNANVEVLGTQFNVKAWQASLSPKTTVSLTEGSVNFYPLGAKDDGVILTPGETRSIAEGSRSLSPADSLREAFASAWKAGDLVYREEWLGLIIEDIERRFAIDIELQSPDLLKKEFTFVYRQPETADAVISTLCEALGLRYSRTSRGVTIYAGANTN